MRAALLTKRRSRPVWSAKVKVSFVSTTHLLVRWSCGGLAALSRVRRQGTHFNAESPGGFPQDGCGEKARHIILVFILKEVVEFSLVGYQCPEITFLILVVGCA